jgi:entericidin B
VAIIACFIAKDPVMLRKALLVLAAGSIALTAAACNTVKGIGRDIESVGNAGSRAVN